jgi:hypothetical protein
VVAVVEEVASTLSVVACRAVDGEDLHRDSLGASNSNDKMKR